MVDINYTTTPYPTTHEGLLKMAIKNRVAVIGEFGWNFRYECRKLQRWAARYAIIHGLGLECSNELCGIYYDDPQEDVEIMEQLDKESL